MLQLDFKPHFIQKELLHTLAHAPSLRFNQLIINHVESEHMNYHLQKLIDVGLVTKQAYEYSLTDLGKDYVNLVDDDTKKPGKQPKTSVLLHIIRIDEKLGQTNHLLNKRLKHPYFGKIGRITGKVKFGETIEAAARREMLEETGLEGGEIFLEQVYHKLRKREDGKYVQDVIYYRFLVRNPKGSLIEEVESQRNFWINKTEFEQNKSQFDLYDDFEFEDRTEPLPLRFIEHEDIENGF